jgi:hypothetical protein
MKHPAAEDDSKLLEDCEVRFLRRSGPGGQHRNKTETAVCLKHRATGIEAEAAERRSQADNKRVATFRLRLNLAVGVRASVEATKLTSETWNARLSNGRLAIAASHTDFPTILAEALDHLEAFAYRLDEASRSLRITSSQLVKLLKQHRAALDLVNQRRTELGIGPLR